MNSLEQQTERFAILPPDFQEAIRNFDYDKRLQQIDKKFRLHIDQLVALETALANIVFGELKSMELTSYIETNLRVNREKASEIALDVNENILMPLREKIKLTQDKNNGGSGEYV